MELPPRFLARMENWLDDEYPAFLASLASPPSTGLRVNTLKLSPQDFLQLSPFPLTPLPWTSAGFFLGTEHVTQRETLRESSQPGRHPYHKAGLYYLQDPSAMAVAEILAPQPGEKVLDLAAAPGGKTTHLAARMQGQGLLLANEIHPRRVWDLAENMERFGITNAAITNDTPEHLAAHFGAFFDRVLVDAPCSGEGLFRKNPAARVEWSEALVQSCASRQGTILAQAAKLVRPGGWLAYSTCTFAPEEDENVIATFLSGPKSRQEAIFELVSLEHIPGLSPARPDWVVGQTIPELHLERCGRFWPHHSAGEGHFIALMRRMDDSTFMDSSPSSLLQRSQYKGIKSPNPFLRPDDQAHRLYTAFCREAQTEDPFAGELVRSGAYLYRCPSGLPSLSGLKVIHPGLWLGSFKKDRFEPSHALAMALSASQVRHLITLDPGSVNCAAYLRGEMLLAQQNMDHGDGWVLLALPGLDGQPRFPLGWGRQIGRQIKNFYPKGLRTRSG